MHKKYITTFILASIFIIALIMFGFWAIVTWKGVGFGVFAVLIIISLLVGLGLIGPSSWKNFFRGYVTWLWTKARLFFPLNPYKPIDEALKGGVEEFLPTKERAKNWLLIKVIGIIFSIILFILLFILYKFLLK